MLSSTDAAAIHIARAFVMNPEVLRSDKEAGFYVAILSWNNGPERVAVLGPKQARCILCCYSHVGKFAFLRHVNGEVSDRQVLVLNRPTVHFDFDRGQEVYSVIHESA